MDITPCFQAKKSKNMFTVLKFSQVLPLRHFEHIFLRENWPRFLLATKSTDDHVIFSRKRLKLSLSGSTCVSAVKKWKGDRNVTLWH